MEGFLDFKKNEKGFKPFQLTAENIKKNKGKRICYVLSRDWDRNRGYYKVRYGVIDSKYYSTLILDGGNDNLDIRDVLECGIEDK